MAHVSEKRILVVDDEPDVRNFLAACLEDAGFDVETAVDGIDALEKAEAYSPDLMTLDMVMPRLNGIKVIRKLREQEKWANLPVIVITAHAQDEMGSDQVKEFVALTSGLRPRITMEKPISPANLVKTICKILDVEPEAVEKVDAKLGDERNKILNLISETDSDTLKKISEMLKNK
ncbi:MAG: response regulator [Desulfobacterales bacterium]|nr:response regulator [Desulfobacterales bacterium]